MSNTCCSIKSKKEPNVRCSHPTVNSSEYCGIHINAKTLVRFVGGIGELSPKVEISKETPPKKQTEVSPTINKKQRYSGNESEPEKRASTRIQSAFRGWNIRRRSKSNNIEDCGTLERLIVIPIEYYIQYQDATDNLWYGFDIRTLESILESKHPVNPYNT
jgi:hypothetical protein